MTELWTKHRLLLLAASRGFTLDNRVSLRALRPFAVWHSICRFEELKCFRDLGQVGFLPPLPCWDRWLVSFCATVPQVVEYDAEATTYDSCGLVLLAALLSGTRNADLIANVTSFPRSLVHMVLEVADEHCLWCHANVRNLRRRLILAEPFASIEAALNGVKENFWQVIPDWTTEALNTLRGGHQFGGKMDDWAAADDVMNMD